LIFVSVGSQKFQMNRLLMELDRLCGDGSIRQEVLAQTGRCSYRPVHFRGQPFYPREEMEQAIQACDLLICHGGTGTILSGIRMGRKVIVVPRLSRYGEHVDDHQQDLAAAFEGKGYLLVAWETGDILAMVEHAAVWTPQPYVSNTEHFVAMLRDLLSKMEAEKHG